MIRIALLLSNLNIAYENLPSLVFPARDSDENEFLSWHRIPFLIKKTDQIRPSVLCCSSNVTTTTIFSCSSIVEDSQNQKKQSTISVQSRPYLLIRFEIVGPKKKTEGSISTPKRIISVGTSSEARWRPLIDRRVQLMKPTRMWLLIP